VPLALDVRFRGKPADFAWARGFGHLVAIGFPRAFDSLLILDLSGITDVTDSRF
jgi:hypothetical protein